MDGKTGGGLIPAISLVFALTFHIFEALSEMDEHGRTQAANN